MSDCLVGLDGIVFSLQRQGGISVYFRELLGELSRRSVPTRLYLEQPLQGSTMPPERALQQISRQARLLERYRACRLDADVSLFHSSYYRLPARRDVPTVVTVHDFIYERYFSGARKATHVMQKHRAIRAAQAVICVSESTRRDLQDFVGERQGQVVHVIHNGVSDVFQPLGMSGAAGRHMLFVGARAGYKNFILALRCLALLPEFELHCVGGGSFSHNELAGLPASVRERVRHHGYADGEMLNRLYNQAFCLLYPSSHEGFGIPVIEAMRAGCPVVSIDCLAVREVGGEALSVASDTSPEALAQAVLQLAEPAHRQRMILLGQQRAAGYSWAATHARTLRVYGELGLAMPAEGGLS